MGTASRSSVGDRLGRYRRRLRQAMRTEIYAFWRRRRVRPSWVMYESFAGNGMLCNPEAIFRALLVDPDFAQLRHVWVLRSRAENPSVVAEFRRDRRVRFVRPRTFGYYRALATSGYLINNATFASEFSKRQGQIYLNTWHGTPLKKMGFDLGDAASRVGNVIRNFLATDYLLSASRYMTEKLYLSAHALGQIYAGRVVEEGYPRIDRQMLTPQQTLDARGRLTAAGVAVGDRKIILYAPTWKGTSFSEPRDDIRELADRLEYLAARVDSDEYVVLLKTHQVVHQFASSVPGLSSRLVPNEIPTNVVLGVTDVLITDYSSIFFDFLPSERPVLFLTPDIDDYSGYRGLYIEPEEWPGPVVHTLDELVHELNEVIRVGPGPRVQENYRLMRERFAPKEDGGATGRVIDIVFRGRRDGFAVSPIDHDGRKTVLVNAGSMRPNGITSGLLGLLSQVDQSRFDVSIVFPNSRRPVVLAEQQKVAPGIRQFARVGEMNGSKFTHLARLRSLKRGDLRIHGRSRSQRRLWDDEWVRCFGGTTFDHVIDYSGYGAFGATLMLHAPGARKSIWLHSDMRKDSERVAHDQANPLNSLEAIFSLYREYDHLVSESPALATINAASLSDYAPTESFTVVTNALDGNRIEAEAMQDLLETSRDAETGTIPEWAELLAASSATTFVTVARLTQDKNLSRALRSFDLLHQQHPNTRLLILGEGPERESLIRQIAAAHLTGSVSLTGIHPAPAAVMAHATALLVASDYDSAPMVMLEAAVLGLPIVATSFPGVADVPLDGRGFVVEGSDAAVASALSASLEAMGPAAPFDWRSWNEFAASGLTSLLSD